MYVTPIQSSDSDKGGGHVLVPQRVLLRMKAMQEAKAESKQHTQ